MLIVVIGEIPAAEGVTRDPLFGRAGRRTVAAKAKHHETHRTSIRSSLSRPTPARPIANAVVARLLIWLAARPPWKTAAFRTTVALY
jgi:hypothetical protein